MCFDLAEGVLTSPSLELTCLREAPLAAGAHANTYFFLWNVCLRLIMQIAVCRKLQFPGFLVPSCPKRALVWGMVVRGFARRDLC